MPLPVRPHHPTAPLPRSNRVLHNVVTVRASDPCLEFLSEDPREAAVREPIFNIAPIPIEPPRHVVELRTQDQFPGRRPNVSLRFLQPRTVLIALRRSVVGALLALYGLVVGAFVALYRGVLGTLLALYRAVVGAVLALCRRVVGALVALYRGVTGAILALCRGVVRTLLALYRGAV